MYRNVMAAALAAAVFLTGSAQALDMTWDGGPGEWNFDNWNGGMTPAEVLGSNRGAEGSEDNIIIGAGAEVLYDANEIQQDFRMRQGNTFTISEGASWTQLTLPDWSENRWTEMDLSELILDNGTFNRVGSVPGEGGGALLFGSWMGDDNFGVIPPPQEININITNGGGINNEGQLWFGGWEDHPAGLIVNMTINNGSLDLTGGDVPGVGDEADGDLVFIFDIDEDGRHSENPGDFKNEDYNINFTGPGSITVDSSGIIAPFKIDTGGGNYVWTNLEPITYEEVWEAGILQANGLDVNSGRSFDEFFMVEGELGSDDYKLISLLTTGFAGDVNEDGQVDVADLNIIGVNWQMMDKTRAEGDLNGDGNVDVADLNILALDWQMGVAAAAAVPEPSTVTLLLVALLGSCGILRKRRC